MPNTSCTHLGLACVILALCFISMMPKADAARKVLTLNETLEYFLNGSTLSYFVNGSACDHENPSKIYPIIPHFSYGEQLLFGYAFVQTHHWFVFHSTYKLVNDSWLNVTGPITRLTTMFLYDSGHASINLHDWDSRLKQHAIQDFWCNVTEHQIVFTAPDHAGTRLHTYLQVAAALKAGETLSFAADLANCTMVNITTTTTQTTTATTTSKSTASTSAATGLPLHPTTRPTSTSTSTSKTSTASTSHSTSAATGLPLHPTAKPTPTKQDHVTPDIVGRGLFPRDSSSQSRGLGGSEDGDPRHKQRPDPRGLLQRLAAEGRGQEKQGRQNAVSMKSNTRANLALPGNATWAGVIKDFWFDSQGALHAALHQPKVYDDQELELVFSPQDTAVVSMVSHFRDISHPPRLNWRADCRLAEGGGVTVIQW